MQTQITHELLVVSDIHITNLNDSRAQLFLKFLSLIDTTKVRYLILLGDIFDFCFGSSEYFHKKFAEVGKELTRISREHVNIFFFEGNHEFFVQDLPWVGVKFINKKSLSLTLKSGISMSFTHGDFINAPWHYKFYAHIIRSKVSRFFARRTPQGWLDSLALGISSKSRQRSYAKNIDDIALKQGILNWLHEEDSAFGVFGHFHMPFEFFSEDHHRRALCLESWDIPNFLSYNAGHFYRNYFKKDEIHSILQTA